MQSRYSWKYRRTGYVRFSLLGQNKMSAYCVYDLKSCRSYMIRLIIKVGGGVGGRGGKPNWTSVWMCLFLSFAKWMRRVCPMEIS